MTKISKTFHTGAICLGIGALNVPFPSTVRLPKRWYLSHEQMLFAGPLCRPLFGEQKHVLLNWGSPSVITFLNVTGFSSV
jgi:hypothetical protein